MIKGTATPDTVSKILDRLSTDNDFREQLLGDPKTALAQYGLDVDASKLPATRSLPSKDEIKATHQELHSKIQSNLGLIMFLAV